MVWLGSRRLEALKADAKVDITHVPFAGGAEYVPAVLGGHVDGVNAHPSEVLPHVQAVRMRVLAVYGDKRDPLFPDAPTFRELGHDAAKWAMDDPGFVSMAKARGYAIDYKGPEALRQEFWDSYRKNEVLLRKLGLGKS